MSSPPIALKPNFPPETEVLQILKYCCAQRVTGSLRFSDSPESCIGKFVSVTEEEVCLELLYNLPNLQITDQSHCGVTFPLPQGAGAFNASIRAVRKGQGFFPARLILSLPEEIRRFERRSNFRFPLKPEDGLLVTLLDPVGESWRPLAINISRTGILLEFPPEDGPFLPTGTQVELNLTLEEQTGWLLATVSRKDQNRYGLAFVLEGETLPPAMERILKTIERRWLFGRKD